MKLGEAHELLLSLTKSSDNARYFKETHDHAGFPRDRNLADYLSFINDNCDAWFRGLPDKLSSETALAKPKSGILKLINEPKVIEDVGADLCKALESELNRTWKRSKDAYIAERKPPAPAIDETVTALEDDGISEASTVIVPKKLKYIRKSSLTPPQTHQYQHDSQSDDPDEPYQQDATNAETLENIFSELMRLREEVDYREDIRTLQRELQRSRDEAKDLSKSLEKLRSMFLEFVKLKDPETLSVWVQAIKQLV